MPDASRPVVLLDLDDTLYPEADFVESGHRVVAAEIAARTGIAPEEVFTRLRYEFFKYGRSGLFDRMVDHYDLPREAVSTLVRIYRDHEPALRLGEETREVLRELRRHWRLGLVTDGTPAVQRRKVAALGLAPLVDSVVYTWEIGAPKPDPAGFARAAAELGGSLARAIIVGDDPFHDVAAAHAAGLACVRLRAHRFATIETPFRPRHYLEIPSITALPSALSQLQKEIERKT